MRGTIGADAKKRSSDYIGPAGLLGARVLVYEPAALLCVCDSIATKQGQSSVHKWCVFVCVCMYVCACHCVEVCTSLWGGGGCV